MQINYKFLSDKEPNDEQLHLLMQEVAIEAKKKAREPDEKFSEELQQLLQVAQQQRLAYYSPAK